MKTTRCTFPTSLLREGEAIGADERSEIGGDFRGDFLEFVAGGVAGQLKTLGGNVGSHGDDGTVARVRSGGTCEFVERLPGSFEVVDADIKNDVRAHWFTPHEKAARAILLIGLGKIADIDGHSASGRGSRGLRHKRTRFWRHLLRCRAGEQREGDEGKGNAKSKKHHASPRNPKCNSYLMRQD